MKQEIITKLETLLQQEDFNTASAQIKNLQREYEDAFSKEMEKAKETFTDEGGRARDFIYTKSKEDEQIVELFDKFRKIKKQHTDKLQTEQQKNFEVKTNIIRDINDLSKLDINMSSAVKKLHELQAKYKETGNVPSAQHKDVMADYNKAVDTFYFGLNLYKESQEVDLKKNFEFKTELLQKINNILTSENAKEVERLIKVYRKEWEEAGPVPQDKWTAMREDYKTANEQVNKKLQVFYGDQKEQLLKNLETKKQLIEKAKQIFVGEAPRNEKEWEQKTNIILDIQNEYKLAGHTDKQAGDEVWKQFREVCDTFFEKKKSFYEKAKERYEEAKQKKIKLIENAEAIKNSKDWQQTSEKIINLQQQWKRLPNAHPKDEHKLYEQFRAICNHFFEAKRAEFAQQNAELENNIQHKETIVQNLHGFAPSGNAKEDVNALKEFTKQWQDAGQVPMAERKRLNDTFYNKLEEFYSAVAGSEEEKQLIKFKLKIERFENAEDGLELLRRENDFIRKQMSEIQAQVNTYENNMGFFKSSSKTKSPMMAELENKVAVEKAKVDEWKKKKKMVDAVLDKLSKPVQ